MLKNLMQLFETLKFILNAVLHLTLAQEALKSILSQSVVTY